MQEELDDGQNPFERNEELSIKLKEKLTAFGGQMNGLTIAITVMILIQFSMLLWLVLK